MGRVAADGHCPGAGDSNSKMQGVRDLGADSLVGDPVPAGDLALQLDGCGNGGSRSTSWADDGDRGCWEPEEEKPRRKSMSLEDLRKRYSWWPNGGSKEEQPGPLIDVGAGEEDSATLKVVRSTTVNFE